MHKDDEVNYWSSFSDMSFGLLLLFALIMTLYVFLFTMQVKQKEEDLYNQGKQIDEKEQAIEEAKKSTTKPLVKYPKPQECLKI